jgi:hypothetical protein
LGGQSLPRRKASSPRSREKPLERADYTDEHGQIDKQKLLDIATRNATKLAMVCSPPFWGYGEAFRRGNCRRGLS